MVLSFKVDKGLKELLERLADEQHRSVSNMVVHIIREYFKSQGIEYDPKNQK